MFCVKCGKESEIRYLCEKCYLQDKHLIFVEDFSVDKCPKCSIYKTKNLLNHDIDKILIEKFMLKDPKFSKKEKGGNINVNIKSKIFLPELEKSIKFENNLDIRIKSRQCSDCSMKSGNYHEAIIQIRGENQENILKNLLNSLKENEITNINKIKEGYDIKLIRKSKAASVMSVVKDNCDIKTSFKLVGERNGHKLYRDTYSVR